jgi:trehalose 6-phosphate synthase/phosphatase
MESGVIIVSNRLPVTAKRADDGSLAFSPSVGGLATGLASYAKDPKNKWIGWPGIASDELSEKDKAEITERLNEQNCYPVFLSQKQIESYYNGYSNSVLWPLFHSLPPIAKKAEHENLWQSYKTVNRQFADAVLALAQPGSTIWVHDYQLLLLPKLLRDQREDADQIGFFLHIPFPPAEDFAGLAEARLLLEGMLGADLVGLHTYSYTDHFLDCCEQLGIGEVSDENVRWHERNVQVTDFPMGIDYDKFAQAAEAESVKIKLAQLRKAYKNRKVILTVDRLDPSKGLVERLEAYEQFLRSNRALRGKVVMIMLVVPSRTGIAAYRQLKRKIDALVTHINEVYGTLSWQPVDFMYDSLPFEQLAALYQLADVALIVPLRDGMNLVAKEYIASQPRHNGVLILSETAGAAQEMQDAIQVEPTEPKAVAKALKQAVTMPTRELHRRTKRMQNQLEDAPVQKWARGFMRSLERSGASTSRVGLPRSLTKLRQQKLAEEYQSAKHRLLMLDYDGVLHGFMKNPKAAAPSKETLNLIRKLAKLPGNQVVIVSGRSQEDLDNWFGDLPVGLAAEHGALLRDKDQKKWQVTSDVDPSWHDIAQPILEKYTSKAPGALVESKAYSLAWHYRAASAYYGQKNLTILRRLLRPLAKTYDLTMESGNKVLELRASDIHKGRAAEHWLAQKPAPDFILALGDDTTDEAMFASLPTSAYTIKIGRARTAARYYLTNLESVRQLLDLLAATKF